MIVVIVVTYLVPPEVVDVTLEHRLAAHINCDIIDGAGEHGVSAPSPSPQIRGGGGVVVAGGRSWLHPTPGH